VIGGPPFISVAGIVERESVVARSPRRESRVLLLSVTCRRVGYMQQLGACVP
jgi:hypothetical protein